MGMCVTETSIVLAIYGPSSVGKSTLATELGARLQTEVRHCGDILRERATELNIPLHIIPVELHRVLDAETRRHSENPNGILVVEGRYLNIVLFGIPRVKLLRLTCDEVTREHRLLTHLSNRATVATALRQRDQEDARLRQKLYGDSPQTSEDWMIFDTTHSSPERLASFILDRLQEREGEPLP